jgi:hypothetical protein
MRQQSKRKWVKFPGNEEIKLENNQMDTGYIMKTKILSPKIYGHCPRKIGHPRKPAETSSTQHSNLPYQNTNPNGALPSKLLKGR